MEEGGLMNKAGREGIWAGRGKVWLREAAASICPSASIGKTADGGWHGLQKRYRIVTVHQRSQTMGHHKTSAQVLHVGFHLNQTLQQLITAPHPVAVLFERNQTL